MNREMQLTYGQLETLITAMLDVHDERRTALTARFKLLRRHNFPEGVNLGKSGRFAYDLDAVMKAVVAFALMDSLVQPQVATALVTAAWPGLRVAVATSLMSLKLDRDGRVDLSATPRSAKLLAFQPMGHGRWNAPAAGAGDEERVHGPAATAGVRLLSAQELQDDLATPPADGPRAPLTVVDLHSLVAWTASAIVAAGWAKLQDLVAASR